MEAEPLLPDKSEGETQETAREFNEGKYHHNIAARGSVYNALIFGPAVTKLQTGKLFGKNTRSVLYMALVNFIVQLGLLYIMMVYNSRDASANDLITTKPNMARQLDLQRYRTYETKGDAHFLADAKAETRQSINFAEEQKETSIDPKGKTVCTLSEGLYSCAPAILDFTSEWDELDLNDDGVWDIKEAIGVEHGSTRAEKRHLIYFQAITQSLKHRAKWLQEEYNKTLYLPRDILAERAIPKPYFDYWVGDAQFCSRFDSATCEYIAVSGIFKSALSTGSAAAGFKGIFDYKSAATYCSMMLDGFCKEALPRAYAVNTVKTRQSVCGTVTMQSAGVISNPTKPTDVFQVFEPRYEKIEREAVATEELFIIFLIMIMFLFYSSLLVEMQKIVKNIEFNLNFPGTSSDEDTGVVDNGSEAEQRYKVCRMSPTHRRMHACTTFLRLAIFCMLAYFGTKFLITQTSYIELVLNAVALVFIADIDEMIYDTFLDNFLVREMGLDDNCEPVFYYGHMPNNDVHLSGKLCSRHTWGVLFIPLLSSAVVLYWHFVTRIPTIEALNCACSQNGPKCAESLEHQGAWWDQYWTNTLPAAIEQVQTMRKKGV